MVMCSYGWDGWLVAAPCRNFAALRYGLRLRYGLLQGR